MEAVKDFFVKYYTIYSDFIHSFAPGALGDLIVYIIDIAVIILIVKMIANFAFSKNS